MKIRVLGLIGALGLVGAGTPASALSFTFSQGGYSEGAVVTGTFSGVDLDLNGQLAGFGGDEISAFSMSFSGNSIVSAFSLGIDDLFGLVYDLGTPFLGDGLTLGIEGIGATGSQFEYETGQGPLGTNGGFVGNLDPSVTDSTELLVSVVPEPSTLTLFALGLVGMAAVSRRRPARAQ
jgi:hypothetical protein